MAKERSHISKNGIFVLASDKDAKTFVQSAPLAYFVIHQTGCGACMSFMPEFREMASALHPVMLAEAHYESVPEIVSRHKIRSVPTILFVTKGHAVPYQGERSLEGLFNFTTDYLTDPLSLT
jgi:thiol-disulfide isomerase/thioredoxin